MKAAPSPRWAMSLADLALLLLGFFILLHISAGQKTQVADSIRGAFGAEPAAASRFEAHAVQLFEPGEARLTPAARTKLEAIGASTAATGGRIHIESLGKDPASDRFDGWELAAARVAATARAIEDGGLAEPDIDIAMPNSRSEALPGGHRIVVRVRD